MPDQVIFIPGIAYTGDTLTVLVFEGSIVIGRNFRDQMKSTGRYDSIDTSVVNYVNGSAMKNWRANWGRSVRARAPACKELYDFNPPRARDTGFNDTGHSFSLVKSARWLVNFLFPSELHLPQVQLPANEISFQDDDQKVRHDVDGFGEHGSEAALFSKLHQWLVRMAQIERSMFKRI